MKRREFLKKYTPRFLAAVLLIGIMAYTVYHVTSASSAGLITTPARAYTDQKMLVGRADLFRNEQVLTVAGTGVVNGLTENGTKVSKNAELAQVWMGYADAESARAAQIDLERLNRLISVVEQSEIKNPTAAQAQACREEASALLLEIQRAKIDGDWASLGTLSDQLLIYLNRYQLLTQQSESYEGLLQDLKAQKTALLLGNCLTVQNEQASGFFYDRREVDGKEGIYAVSELETLTPSRLDELRASTPVLAVDSTIVGKVVYGYTWYLAVELSCNASTFTIKENYEITFSGSEKASLSMQCYAINEGEDGRIVAVFSCDEMPRWFSWERTRTVEIAVDSVTGLYVPDSALVENDGVIGVYIYSDSVVRFRRVEILHRGNGYCVVADRGNEEGYLALYDVLILSGKKLYDGKVYQ